MGPADNGTLLASADNYGYTYLWNVSAAKTVGQFHGAHDWEMNDVAFSPDGNLLAMPLYGDSYGDIYVRLTGKLVS